MQKVDKTSALIIGLSLFLGLATLGWFLGSAVQTYKQFDRSVTVKGLSEQEYPADIALWPISFSVAGNDLQAVYSEIERNTVLITSFLEENDVEASEISTSAPSIIDKIAQQYGNNQAVLRYTATVTVTVYTKRVEAIRKLMSSISDLGKKGIIFSANYESRTEYIFTRLNDIKPAMIKEATTKAREVAEKFAEDSGSVLGKIKKASQGRFSIAARDRNTPYIKKVRVVSTVEYYLSD